MKTASGTFLSLEKQKVVSSIVVTTLLVSFSMLFATLFLIYTLYRMTAMVWPPGGEKIPHIWWSTVSTFVILLSSMSLVQFQRRTELERPSQGWFVLTFSLGIVFLYSQWGVWGNLKSLGIYADTSVLASIMYAFTWIHGAHIILGLVFLSTLIPLVVAKEHSAFGKYFVRFQVANKFWHFLGIVWLIMYITLFVI